jgi:para-nitrobenzyl esterase
MVWIHGGGNFAGSAGDTLPTTTDVRWYDGQFFAARHGVVLVSLNYRLGPMGFFSHPALAAEGSPPANQGLLDQHLLLEWVRDNVADFGGDPGNVTIFGESAGSADVCYHVTSPRARGLFHRAVSESGGCTMAGGLDSTIEAARPGQEAFARKLGCDTAADVLACLRAKPAAEIMSAAQQPEPMSGAPLSFSFGAILDGPGGYRPEAPKALFERGDVAKVPYILGSNNDEGTLFVLNAKVTTEEEYQAALTSRFHDAAAEIEARYPASRYGGDFKAALAAVVGDSGLICGTHDTARRAQKAGLPVYSYNFNIPWGISPDALKAAHASEISHVFGNPYKADAPGKAVSDAMNAYWSAFAASGNPNYPGAPSLWPAFAPDDNDSDERIQFDPTGVTTVRDFKKDECAFWRNQPS